MHGSSVTKSTTKSTAMESGGSLPSASLTLAPMMVNTQDSPDTKSVAD